jgi:hypothetical protein
MLGQSRTSHVQIIFKDVAVKPVKMVEEAGSKLVAVEII